MRATPGAILMAQPRSGTPGTGRCARGVFDLSATPAGGDSPLAYGLDPTFRQLQYVAEVEERHDLWGQPGKVKVTGFVSHRPRRSLFQDANTLAL